jgi:transcriptional regulator with GAF, ATPase, and Fis domain
MTTLSKLLEQQLKERQTLAERHRTELDVPRKAVDVDALRKRHERELAQLEARHEREREAAAHAEREAALAPERARLRAAFEANGWSYTSTAKALGMRASSLWSIVTTRHPALAKERDRKGPARPVRRGDRKTC